MLDRILRRKRQCRTENAPQLRVPVKLPHRLRTKEIVVIFAPFGEADKSRRAAFPAPSFSLFCWPLRRMQECSGIPRSPFFLSLSLSLSLSLCILGIPACSNYEKECSFATRQGTHNGQRPLETIIERRPKGRTYPTFSLSLSLSFCLFFAVHVSRSVFHRSPNF